MVCLDDEFTFLLVAALGYDVSVDAEHIVLLIGEEGSLEPVSISGHQSACQVH